MFRVRVCRLLYRCFIFPLIPGERIQFDEYFSDGLKMWITSPSPKLGAENRPSGRDEMLLPVEDWVQGSQLGIGSKLWVGFIPFRFGEASKIG